MVMILTKMKNVAPRLTVNVLHKEEVTSSEVLLLRLNIGRSFR